MDQCCNCEVKLTEENLCGCGQKCICNEDGCACEGKPHCNNCHDAASSDQVRCSLDLVMLEHCLFLGWGQSQLRKYYWETDGDGYR